MSHDLELNANGQANMVWADTPCWHGLGTKMDPKQGAIAWMKAANLDWEVKRQPMFTELPNGEHATVVGRTGQEYAVLVRDHGNGKFDHKEDVFGPCGPDWTAVQNEEVFTFMEKFCKAGKMKMETCGALKGGTEIWALAKYRDDYEILKGDTMRGYLLFHNAHVWGKGNQLKNTPTRVVCNNTLNMALSKGVGKGKRGTFRMPHVKAFDADVQRAAEEAVGLANSQMDDLKVAAEFLSGKQAKPEAVQEFIAQLYQPKTLVERKAANDFSPLMDQFTPSSNMVWESIQFAPGSQLKSAKGNWWGAFNGVTYFEDHMRVSYSDQTNVLGSAFFGSGARRKEEAMVLATEYARVA
jgi:phage/plasmid-like protein (TIGR03299 family)